MTAASSESGSEFACPACDRRFRWKPKLAGRQAKCGCGAVISVPETDPGTASGAVQPLAVEPVDAIFDFAEPEVAAPISARPQARPMPAARPPQGPALDYRPQKSRQERDRDAEMSVWGHPSERRAPLVILALSAAISFGLLLYSHGDPWVVTIYSVVMLIAIGVMVGAAFVAAAVAGINFGVLGLAVIRLAAVCFAIDAAENLIARMEFAGSGLVSFAVRLAIFYGLMMWFFALSFGEVIIVALILFLVRFAIFFVLLMVVISLGVQGL